MIAAYVLDTGGMLIAFKNTSECSITAVQMRRDAGHDKKLRTGGVRAHTARHGQDAQCVLERIFKTVAGELAADGITGAAHAGALRVTALDHESWNDTVEEEAIVKTAVGQRDEIADCLRRVLRVKLALHYASVLHGNGKDRMIIILHFCALQKYIIYHIKYSPEMLICQ